MLRVIANRSLCDNTDVAWIRDEFSQFCGSSKKARFDGDLTWARRALFHGACKFDDCARL
jgi:hypothetical protein